MSRKFPVSIAHQLGAINRMKALREESEAKISALDLLVDSGEEDLKPATDPTTGSTVINEEVIHNFLGNIRLSDICLAHGDQFVPDAEPISEPTELQVEEVKISKSRKPVVTKSPTHSPAPASNNKPAESKRSSSKPTKVNLWRAAANLEPKPKLDSLLDGDFLNKLEGKMEKASMSSLHDQLNQRMMKDASDFVSVKPKQGKSKDKSKKKKAESNEHNDSAVVSSNRIRAKITSVQKFNELLSEKKSQDY